MGPDLFGIAWATALLLAVVLVFAALDRAVCGAWAALRESPGRGLVAGFAAWGREGPGPDEPGGGASGPDDGDLSPDQPDGVVVEHVRGPGLLPWGGYRRQAMVAAPC